MEEKYTIRSFPKISINPNLLVISKSRYGSNFVTPITINHIQLAFSTARHILLKLGANRECIVEVIKITFVQNLLSGKAPLSLCASLIFGIPKTREKREAMVETVLSDDFARVQTFDLRDSIVCELISIDTTERLMSETMLELELLTFDMDSSKKQLDSLAQTIGVHEPV